MAKIKKKVSIEEKFYNQFKEKDFKGWYLNWYHLTSFLIVVCLVGSAIASFKYYEYSLPTFYGSQILAGSLTVLASGLIWAFTDHVFKYWYTQQDWDYILPLLIILIGWNAYTDLTGAPEIATDILSKSVPINSKEDGIKNDIAAIEKKEAALLSAYSWKGKTPVKIPLRSKWHDTKTDRATMKQYHERKAVLNKSLESNNNQFNAALSEHNASIERYKGNLKGFSIGLTLAFILMTGFRYNFASNVSANYKPVSVKPKKKGKKKKAVSVNPSKQAEDFYKKAMTEIAALREENAAMIENEKRQKQTPDYDIFK